MGGEVDKGLSRERRAVSKKPSFKTRSNEQS